MISSYAGTGTGGSSGDGGAATGANINVLGIAIDRNGNLLIADGVNNRVRIVTVADGLINTMAGNGIASFNPRGLVNYGILYFSDSVLNRVRGYTASSGAISVIAGHRPGLFHRRQRHFNVGCAERPARHRIR